MILNYSQEYLGSQFKSRSLTASLVTVLTLLTLTFLSVTGQVATKFQIVIPLVLMLLLFLYLYIHFEKKKNGRHLETTDEGIAIPSLLPFAPLKLIPKSAIYATREISLKSKSYLRIDYVGGTIYFAEDQFEQPSGFEHLRETITANTNINTTFPIPIALWTIIFLITCFSSLLLFSGSSTPNIDIISIGAWERNLIFSGEFDRLLSYGFIHENVIHLCVNMLSLLLLSLALEHRVGKFNALLIFFAGVIVSSLGAFFSNYFIVIGASGGVYSLLGAYVADRHLNPDPNKERYKSTTNSIIILAVAIESTMSFLFSNIALSVHLSGFAFGAIYSLLLSKPSLRKGTQIVIGIPTLLILVAFCIRLTSITDQYRYELSWNWLTNDEHPIRTEIAAWGIATSPIATTEGIVRSIEVLEKAQPTENSVTILAALYGRQERYFDALYLANTQIYTDKDSATQLARFERAYTAENPIDISQFAEAETIAVDAICDDKEFVRIHTNETDKIPDVCANQEIIYIRVAEKGARNIRYELDPKFMSLPL